MLLCLTVALDSLKRSLASAARWRHLELRAGKAAPSAGLVAISAGRPAFAASSSNPAQPGKKSEFLCTRGGGRASLLSGHFLAMVGIAASRKAVVSGTCSLKTQNKQNNAPLGPSLRIAVFNTAFQGNFRFFQLGDEQAGRCRRRRRPRDGDAAVGSVPRALGPTAGSARPTGIVQDRSEPS